MGEEKREVNSNLSVRKKLEKLRITEADFMLANRRAARLEEIAECAPTLRPCGAGQSRSRTSARGGGTSSGTSPA